MGFYIAGVASLGSGLLVGGIVALATGSAAGLTVAAGIAAIGLAVGGLAFWESQRFKRRALRLEGTISEQRLLALAEQRGGVLRVVDVARGLGVGSGEAEELLDSMVDEVRVSMQVTESGEIHYVFLELEDPALRMRVAEAEEDNVEVAAPVVTEAKGQ